MIFLFAAFLYGGGGFVVGGLLGTFVGALVGLVGPKKRSSSGCVPALLGGLIGSFLGSVIGLYFAYGQFYSDGPTHGYADRESYRQAEMDAQTKRFDGVIDALKRFHAEKGTYPQRLHELVSGKYLVNLPAVSKLDHQGNSGLVNSSCTYYIAPASDHFVVRVICGFTEDQRGTGYLNETWVYDSRDPSWKPGVAPNGWVGSGTDQPSEAKKE